MSTIKVDNLQTTSGAGLYPAKVWVNFNGTGTVAIRASGDVSSITDLGVGQYQVNFATAMPDSSYAVQISSGVAGVGFGSHAVVDANTNYVSFYQNRIDVSGGGRQDGPYEYVCIFR